MTSCKFFVLFIACAVVPLFAAQLSLSLGWFSQSANNKGEWLQHEIQLLPDANYSAQNNFTGNDAVHWHLVYVQAQACDQLCEQALFILQQLYVGMGRKQLTMKPLVMAQRKPAQLNKFSAVAWQPEGPAANELQNQIVIVNQRGLVLLRYKLDGNPEHMRDLARDIRTDLLRLINYDRSGA
ncbi:hypothetical protein [Cellvibrio sp. OA-2007]|uniref:hypothetical protein n=1 Tax=Cellvibrio sp. OA-2007 TaxID=529823 RepID=UPI00078417EE|nr:hypothetical protein [Cellvibrio sp. OA-2007]